MQLKITDFAKIGKADIKVDGITVIAGQNNTGKTTVGKILYSIFNSLCGIERKVDEVRIFEIDRLCSKYLRAPIQWGTKLYAIENDKGRVLTDSQHDRMLHQIVNEIEQLNPSAFSYERLERVISELFIEKDMVIPEKRVIEELYEKLLNVVRMDRAKVACELVFQFFNIIFASQVQSLKKADTEARVDVCIKDKSISVMLSTESVSIEGSANIMHEAYLIDDPFIIDDLRNKHPYLGPYSKQSIRPRDFLVEKLINCENGTDSIFDTVSAKEIFQRS